MRMHGVQEGLYNLAGGNDHLRDSITDWILDLANIDTCLTYFIEYERKVNSLVNEARLENAKMNYELSKLREINDDLQKKVGRCQEM